MQPCLNPKTPPAIREKIELGKAGKIMLIPLARKIMSGPQIPALSTNNLI